jgi:alpha-glucosidase (family GH31 glycosyl hydrolase)
MKKYNLAIAVFMTLCSVAKSQVHTESNEVSKTEIGQNAPLVFTSLEEKNLQIDKIQKQIDLRISLGKTQEELVPRYTELTKTKNGLIISKTTSNGK